VQRYNGAYCVGNGRDRSLHNTVISFPTLFRLIIEPSNHHTVVPLII